MRFRLMLDDLLTQNCTAIKASARIYDRYTTDSLYNDPSDPERADPQLESNALTGTNNLDISGVPPIHASVCAGLCNQYLVLLMAK